MRIPVSIRTSYNKAEIRALVDSGATDNFMHPNFAKRMGLGLQKLPNPKKLYNVDNTTNKAGEITHFMMLSVETHGILKDMRFLITDIGKEDVLFGYPWLANFEPQFSWKYATIDEKEMPIILHSINPKGERPKMAQATIDRIREEIMATVEDEYVRATTSTELAIAAEQYTKDVEIPEPYQQFAKVFSEEESQRLPPRRACDHTVDFKPGTPDAIPCKLYPMTQKEKDALDKWIDEMLAKGYITPSKSPYASSFFFIKKKDGKL